MISFALSVYNFIKPHLDKLPIRYSLEGAVVVMFLIIYLSKFVHAGLSLLLLRKYDNVQSSHRYGDKSDSKNEANKSSWRTKAVLRAYAAHCNHWEAFTGFAVAVILAVLKAPEQRQELTVLANAFVWVRVLYNVVYVLAFNEPLSFVRSSVWTIGFVLIVRIFIIAVGPVTL
mmetsp:Transcript_22220/g.24222  ORF Transcript_22220/g.24222 Transcript_22220/m.24222 type:complete len:173 (-) Transcript_22220:137-655(-)